jgi:DNA-binding phage protein
MVVASSAAGCSGQGVRGMGGEWGTEGIVAYRQALWYTMDMGELVNAIRKAIETSGKTRYRIAKEAGVAQSQLSRLMSGERDLRVETLERLSHYLDLEIIIRPRRRQPGKRQVSRG